MANQYCPECNWVQSNDDNKTYRFCPKCNYDSQEPPVNADILPFALPKQKYFMVWAF